MDLKMFSKIGEYAAKIARERKYSYGDGIRRKAVQVSSIPGADRFEEKSLEISKAMGLDGRSQGAILAVDVVYDLLGLGANCETNS